MTSLFVYGTLCFPEITKKLTGKSFFMEHAVLKNYQRRKVKDCDYPAIIKNKNSEVKGMILSNVDEDSMKIISFYEGSEYRSKILAVNVNGKKIRACVFVWDTFPERLENFDWNQEDFAQNSLKIYLEKILPETLQDFNSGLNK